VKAVLFGFAHGIMLNFVLSASLRVSGQEINASPMLALYDVKFYNIDLTVDNQSTQIAGNTSLIVELLSDNIDTLVLELTDHAIIDSIRINKLSAVYSHKNDLIQIPENSGMKKGQLIDILVFYKIPEIHGIWKNGIFNALNTKGSPVTYSLSESFEAKSWFPCKQDLNDKADSASVSITVPDTLMAGSNGILRQIIKLPNGKAKYVWKTGYPIDYYLISFSVANYMDYSFKASTVNGDSITVQNYIYKDSSAFKEIKKDIDITADLIQLFSSKFGNYPFSNEKYGHCQAPIGGGMENQTMTTLDNFNFNLVSHELSHQWFGDLVTCGSWQDIWLNEGFASYCEVIALENLKSKNDYTDRLNRAHTSVKSQPDGAVFIEADKATDESRIFDNRLTYEKGLSIIHMIRYELNNDDLFYSILSSYLEKYSNSTATASDFKNLLSERSQINFNQFFTQWYYGEGYPILNFKWEQKYDTLFIKVEQTASAPAKTQFFNLTIDLKLEYYGGDTLLRLKQDTASESYAIPFTQILYKITADPDEWILAKINSVQRILPSNIHGHFNVFPNPTHDNAYVENYNLSGNYSLKIYDNSGIMRKEMNLTNPVEKINLNGLSMGVYYIVITSDDDKERFQLVKI
jgi:aminopeptidase N